MSRSVLLHRLFLGPLVEAGHENSSRSSSERSGLMMPRIIPAEPMKAIAARCFPRALSPTTRAVAFQYTSSRSYQSASRRIPLVFRLAHAR